MSASPLLTDIGREALAAASEETDPGSLAAATRLRRSFPADVAAAALHQAVLRRRARAKFGAVADELLLTDAGLEQASRPEVAAWRARRLADAGVHRVVDLGCGIGADARAFVEAGLDVIAVDIDPVTATFARANVPGARVVVGNAEELADELLAGPDAAVFLDPSRRTARGRTWNVADFTPTWDFVMRMLAERSCVVKLGPGLPKEIIPGGVEACWVSHRGDVVEASLWSGGERFAAVLLPSGERLDARSPRRELPVGPVGRYLYEPDGAVIRAGHLDRIAPGLWLLDPHVAYLSGDELVKSPFTTGFEVLEVLAYDVATLKKWVRERDVGTLEIKKRAIDVDPAELRKRLKPRGPGAATFIIARTPSGARCLVVRRLPAQE